MIYKGTKRADVYLGTVEADVIEGLRGKDTLGGAGGDDQIAGGDGDDTLDGGDGNDVLFAEALGTVPVYGEWKTATLDTLASHDVLKGGLGDDTIFAGTGDVIDGGAGVDRLALSLIRETAGLTLDLDALTAGGTVSLGSTSVSGVERLAALQATAFDDEIRYLAAPDRWAVEIDAADGNDHVVVGGAKGANAIGEVLGGGGDDVLEAVAGFNGGLYGGDGDDHLNTAISGDGGAGDDVLVDVFKGHGGDGDDVISLTRSQGNFSGDAGNDTLTGGKGDDFLYGGDGADILVGGAGDDVLWSGGDGFFVFDTGAEIDRIDAGAGDDHVTIGFGDSADGGGGIDTLKLSLDGAAAGVVLDTTAFFKGGSVELGGGTISGFESFDLLEGTKWDDQITAYGGMVFGGDGDDRLIAAGTGASLAGSAGDDVIVANGHGRAYNGTEGYDTVDFSQLRARITLQLSERGEGTASTGETIGNFDMIVATSFADVIDLGYSNVSLTAGDGNDRITLGFWGGQAFGGAGDDTIVLDNGGAADMGALLSGGEGADHLISSGSIDLSRASVDGTIEWVTVGDRPGATLTMAAIQTRGVTRIDTSFVHLATGGLADFRAVSLNAATVYLSDVGSRVLLGATSTVATIYGGAASDAITSASAATRTVDGREGNDIVNFAGITDAAAAVTLLGGAGNDRLIGGAGADTLNGGVGADFLQGGLGDDRYVAVEIGDSIHEAVNGGIDTVESAISWTLALNVENLVLLGNAERGVGNASANTITANGYNNILDGKAGADVMIGGDGNDTYYVDNVGDRVVEDGTYPYLFIDTVRASVDYTLPDGVENLTMIAAGHAGVGNALANVILGSAGADTLYGMDGDDDITSGGGADQMIGGNGDDTYHVDGSGDRIVEQVDGGADHVIASANTTLSANVESLELIGDARIGQGNGGANVITGSGGDDMLRGMGGVDVLAGGDGADTLFGGAGQDALFGDAGADVFAFAAGDSSADWTQADGIVDFSHAEHDRIDLSALGHLAFIGTAGFSGGAQVRFEEFDGDTLISIDINGDRTADMVIGLIGTPPLTAADFILG